MAATTTTTAINRVKGYHIRPLQEGDIEAVILLDQNENPDPWGAKLIRETLQLSVDTENQSSKNTQAQQRLSWVVEDGSDQVCGCLIATMLLCESELELVLIAGSDRRQGLAKRLMLIWLEFVQQQAVGLAMLEVRESNVGTISLYKKLGFVAVGLRKNYYQALANSNTLNKKDLFVRESKEAAILMNLIIEPTP